MLDQTPDSQVPASMTTPLEDALLTMATGAVVEIQGRRLSGEVDPEADMRCRGFLERLDWLLDSKAAGDAELSPTAMTWLSELLGKYRAEYLRVE